MGDKVDALVVGIDNKSRRLNLSIKALEEKENKETIKQFGSATSGARLGDILPEEFAVVASKAQTNEIGESDAGKGTKKAAKKEANKGTKAKTKTKVKPEQEPVKESPTEIGKTKQESEIVQANETAKVSKAKQAKATKDVRPVKDSPESES